MAKKYSFRWRCFYHNSNSMEMSVCSHPNCSKVITTNICIYQDLLVVSCAKVCCDLLTRNLIITRRDFHGNLIVVNPLVRRVASLHNPLMSKRRQAYKIKMTGHFIRYKSRKTEMAMIILHCSDVTWASLCLRLLAIRLFVKRLIQTYFKENS